MQGKIELISAQGEAIYLEFSTLQVPALSLDQQAILKALQHQNVITPSDVVQAGRTRISLRVSGRFSSERVKAGYSLPLSPQHDIDYQTKAYAGMFKSPI